MSSRWPLNILMWKDASKVDINNPTSADFIEIHDDFEKARNLICGKLKNEGFAAGIMFASTRDEAQVKRDGFVAQPEHIELHYRAWDDPYRGRIVTGGLDSKEAMDKYAADLRDGYENKVFTPNELYALEPIRLPYNGYLGNIEKWLKEENICLHDFNAWDKIKEEGRLDIRYLVDENMGSDESFEIGSLWFDGKPLAVVTHSGEDNSDRYITDVVGWYAMIAYLRTFMVPEEEDKPTVIDADKPLYWLTELDGYHTLHDFYDVETQTKKEKVILT